MDCVSTIENLMLAFINQNRYLREGRLTMAHSIVEKIHLLQLSVAETLSSVTQKYGELRGWQFHEDFAIESEVSKAMAAHLRASGCTVSEEDLPLHVIGRGGKHIYSFDCALLSVDHAGTTTLFFGEVKHHLTSHDVKKAVSNMMKLHERLHTLQTDQIIYEGSPLYVAQLRFYKALIDASLINLPGGVKLFVGGTRVDQEAVKEAAKGMYPIVTGNGGRFAVIPAADVHVKTRDDDGEDDEVWFTKQI